MAINFNTSKVFGIGNMGNLPMTAVNQDGKSIELSTNVSDIKDPLYVIIDLSASFISSKLEVFNADGKLAYEIGLNPTEYNIIPVTTYGCVTKEGKVNFRLTGISGDIESGMAIMIGAFSHISVINN